LSRCSKYIALVWIFRFSLPGCQVPHSPARRKFLKQEVEVPRSATKKSAVFTNTGGSRTQIEPTSPPDLNSVTSSGLPDPQRLARIHSMIHRVSDMFIKYSNTARPRYKLQECYVSIVLKDSIRWSLSEYQCNLSVQPSASNLLELTFLAA
jgi:hypothetical protein